jgi:radical SAM superfamily enzyme YgiQ (UPF0313 family)
MLVYLINPNNPVVSITKTKRSRLNKYRTWKPLSLLVLARMTPAPWTVKVIDENLGEVDYGRTPRPDLVGVTAFTSQATRAYEIATFFRAMGVAVVMGGIHASMCLEEALSYADSVVLGEAESVWAQVLADAASGRLQRVYHGGMGPAAEIPPARHDLLAGRYYLGAIQTTRGCPLRCVFCSVTAFNGGQFRHRPIDAIIAELREIREPKILFVDDNLIGTRRDHIERSKELFRTMIAAEVTRPWICQATVNFADDEELLALAAAAGCEGVLIGFESPTPEGLMAVHKMFNLRNNRDMAESVRRIQQHGIQVVGSFIMGLDTDRPGIGRLIAEEAERYGLDMATVLVLTPLPGTRLYAEMQGEGRIIANRYPEDWQYYTLGYPVARYRNFTWSELEAEMTEFARRFYSYGQIVRRLWRIALRTGSPMRVGVGAVMNLTQRWGHRFHERVSADRHVVTPAAGSPAPRCLGRRQPLRHRPSLGP